jgi:predicted TPR repeat methyltransferase
MSHDRLRGVYDLSDQDATNAYYTEWAATYNDELTRQGYRTPQRCAEALGLFEPMGAPILDIGCGTGISGTALAAVGFTDVCGTDINADMLGVAERADIYRETWLGDIDDPFPFEAGTYAALTAVGVIGVGSAPASLLTEALDSLAPEGHLVFSYNDHALSAAEYRDALADAISTGTAEEVFAERGVHFEGLNSRSTVYVLRRH